MASDTRRQGGLLVGLTVVLAAVLWWQLGGPAAVPANHGGAGRAQRPGARGAAARTPAEVLADGVGLDRLTLDRPAPEDGGRDPFRTGPAGVPSGASASAGQTPGPAPVAVPVVPAGPVQPAGPPPPPPITVKFIGVVSRGDVGKVAVLTDGKNVYYGRAGEIVDGRWRIVSIGEESLQIEYADGRGRQTLRMTG